MPRRSRRSTCRRPIVPPRSPRTSSASAGCRAPSASASSSSTCRRSRSQRTTAAGRSLEMKVIVGHGVRGPRDAGVRRLDAARWCSARTGTSRPNIQARGVRGQDPPSSIAAGNYEYYKDGGVTRIRQKPGPKNSLGLVKFLFPNDFNIYLHDTPQRRAVQEGRARVQPRLHPPREAGRDGGVRARLGRRARPHGDERRPRQPDASR